MKSIRLAGLLAALLPVSALAVPVTYEFTGVVNDYQTSGDPFEAPPIPFLTEFSGSFTIEDSTPPFDSGTGFTAYRHAITPFSVSFGPGGSAGSFEFDGSPMPTSGGASSQLNLLNDLEFMGNPAYDQFNLWGSLGLLPDDPANSHRSFSFYWGGFDTSVLPAGLSLTDPLPTANLIAAGLHFYVGYAQYDEQGLPLLSRAVGASALTSLTQVQTSVPEPATLGMLAVGLLGMGLRRRRAARC